jgi:mannose-6-phosphate isomerase-like protein (cupin superfamily)
MQVIKKGDLPTVRLNGEVSAHVFDGSQHGVSCSAFIVDAASGVGPRRHRHPYDEIFVIVEGTVRLEADGEVLEVSPEEICVVPAGVAHAFTNVGDTRAKMVNLHLAAQVVTEFVDDGSASDVAYEYNHTS